MMKKANPETARQLTPMEVAWEKDVRASIEALGDCEKKLERWPTVSELAHVAAVLRRSDGKSEAALLAREAWDIWGSCRQYLHRQMKDTLHSYEIALDVGMPDTCESEKQWKLRFENGKADFEAALKALVGEKTRKADRYRIFREFMRDQARKHCPNKDAEGIATVTEKRFMELKEGGFPQESFQKAEAWFVEWRKERRHERAKLAAKKRWKNSDGMVVEPPIEPGGTNGEQA